MRFAERGICAFIPSTAAQAHVSKWPKPAATETLCPYQEVRKSRSTVHLIAEKATNRSQNGLLVETFCVAKNDENFPPVDISKCLLVESFARQVPHIRNKWLYVETF